MGARPNIVIFNPDQFRADAMRHLGVEAALTPNMDALVQHDAVSFSNAYCQNPVCTPSRCSFMTGLYPHNRGHRTITHMLHEDEPCLLKILKDNGYTVWWGGKNDLIPADANFEDYCDIKYNLPDKYKVTKETYLQFKGSRSLDKNYSFYLGKVDYNFFHSDTGNVDGAVDFINSRTSSDAPFCVYLPLNFPHPPFGIDSELFDVIDRTKLPKSVPVPDWALKPSMLKKIFDRQNLINLKQEDWDNIKSTYLAMCYKVDLLLGKVIEALKSSQSYDNTALFVFSDHGEYLGDYGLVEKNQNTFEDVLVRVPLIFKPPKSVAVKPRISDALVELVDFPATVAELTGIKLDYWQFGMSLVDLSTGVTDTHRNEVFCEGGRLKGEAHCSESENGIYKDVNSWYYPRLSIQQADGEAHGKAIMVRTADLKYVYRLYEKDELYIFRD